MRRLVTLAAPPNRNVARCRRCSGSHSSSRTALRLHHVFDRRDSSDMPRHGSPLQDGKRAAGDHNSHPMGMAGGHVLDCLQESPASMSRAIPGHGVKIPIPSRILPLGEERLQGLVVLPVDPFPQSLVVLHSEREVIRNDLDALLPASATWDRVLEVAGTRQLPSLQPMEPFG